MDIEITEIKTQNNAQLAETMDELLKALGFYSNAVTYWDDDGLTIEGNDKNYLGNRLFSIYRQIEAVEQQRQINKGAE